MARKPKSGSFTAVFMDMPEWARVGSLVLVAITVLLVRRAYQSEKELMPLGIIALLGGLAFEYRRVFGSWRSLLHMFLGMYAVSLTAFIPLDGNKPYDIETRIGMWPFWFCFLVTIAAMAKDRERITTRMDEGSVLLVSIAFAYWLSSQWQFDIRSGFDAFLLMVVVVACGFVLLHAFTDRPLTRWHRLLLSLWGTCVILTLSVDNALRVWGMDQGPYTTDIWDRMLLFVAFFMLGISSMYLVNNAFLLIDLMPSRGASLSQYRKELKAIKKVHLERFDTHQIPTRYAGYCLLYSLAVYVPNAVFDWVPAHLAIWGVVVSFPLVIHGLFAPDREA